MSQSASPLLPAIRGWARRHQQGLAASLFLFPGLVMFTIYVIAPIIESIGLSFYSWDGLGAAKYIGLENYINLFSDEAFYTALRNNIIWLFCYLLSVPAGLAIALLLNQTTSGIRFVKSVFFFPFVISQVVIGVIFTLFYDPSLGLFVKLLHVFDIKPIAVLSSAHWVTYGIIVAGLYPQIAYCMILYLTGLNNLRPDLIEAARLEGAHGWNMLFKIVLPQLRAATFIAVVVTVIGSLRSFDMISIMTQGGPYGSSATLAYYMYEVALSEYGFRMGYGAAVATVLFLIMLVFIVFILYRVYRQERETS